jgi:hypothetical protein
MKDWVVSRGDAIRMAPNVAGSFLGVLGYIESLVLQANLYGAHNELGGVADAMKKVMGVNPDFLTSFTAPLAAMQLLQWLCLLGQTRARELKMPTKESLFRAGKYLAPIAIAAVFVGYEVSGWHIRGTAYADNSIADNAATCVAFAMSMGTALLSERKIEDKTERWYG